MEAPVPARPPPPPGVILFFSRYLCLLPGKTTSEYPTAKGKLAEQCPLGTTLLIDGQRRLARAVHLRGGGGGVNCLPTTYVQMDHGEFNQNQGTQKRKESSGNSGLSE